MTIGSFMPRRSVWALAIAQLREEFPEHTWLEGLNEDSAELDTLDVILGGRVPPSVFSKTKKLKALFQPFTGLNHLPAEILIAQGVQVYNVHSNAFDVAERALAMTLAFYARIIEFHNDMKHDIWHGFWVGKGAEDNRDSIYGRTCAILGTGAIGKELAGLLKAFRCTVYGWHKSSGGEIPEHFDALMPTMGDAIEAAETVYIALPGTAETENLLSREIVMGMKGKFLVNVGRGAIVNEEGLYEALSQGILKGAAIDTWYDYPKDGGVVGAPSRYPINKLPNVIASPHVGGATNQATKKSVGTTLLNIQAYLRTGKGIWLADLKKMY